MPFDGHEKTGLNIPVLDKFSSIWVRWDRIIRAYRDNTRFVVIIVRDYDDVKKEYWIRKGAWEAAVEKMNRLYAAHALGNEN